MNYQESLDFLYKLGHETLTVKFGLANTETMLAALNQPQDSFLKIQVAGTNGKGSTCQFLNSICLAANLKVGLYTSPHLVSITERIRIGNENISEQQFAELTTEVLKTAQKLIKAGKLETLPTLFEHLTVIALLAFQTADVDVAILETGLGGRLDATTAAGAEVVVLTPISLDHQEYLGNTLNEIAQEKAAIIRPKTRVVVSSQQESEAMRVIDERCRKVGVEPTQAAQIVEVQRVESSKDLAVSFKTKTNTYERIKLSLLGRHQLENAATAISLAETICEFGFKVTKENVRQGLETAEHAGRLELLFDKNLSKRPPILFDGAHNAAGANALRAFLLEFYPNAALTIVFGAMRDKDLTEISAKLFPLAQHLILTRVNNPRAAAPEELCKFVAFEPAIVSLAETVDEALKLAVETSNAQNLIVVTGSLYLVGEAKRILQLK